MFYSIQNYKAVFLHILTGNSTINCNKLNVTKSVPVYAKSYIHTQVGSDLVILVL